MIESGTIGSTESSWHDNRRPDDAAPSRYQAGMPDSFMIRQACYQTERVSIR
jgi:hypothetical protein